MVGPNPTIEANTICDNNSNDLSNAETVGPQSIPYYQDGRFSTTSNLKIVTYEEATGRLAGTPFLTSCENPGLKNSSETPADSNESPFSPFKSQLDYGVAMFFHRRQLTKGDVDDFLHDKNMESVVDQLSFKNANQWREKLLETTNGLPLDDQWFSGVATIEREIIGLPAREYQFYYQDVENVIRFLLGHIPFKENLVYSPMHVLNENEDRVYTEMHTGDWWWQTQNKLPDEATIVPLLVAVDKTTLTQHHGDLAAWPIYLTIGNLDHQTRRQQSRPSLILIGFLPIAADQQRAKKSALYHYVMRLIFKRKLYWLIYL
jgi:hypothetical protein